MPTENARPARVQFIYRDCEPDGLPEYVVMPFADYQALRIKALPAHFQNVHPGEVLSEEFLIPLKCVLSDLADSSGISWRYLRELTDGRKPVTADIAAKLAGYFGTSAEFWLGLQADFDAEQARRGQGKIGND